MCFHCLHIEDCLDSLRGNVRLSILDLAACAGYWQIAVEETSKEKMAFATPDDTYQFNVMPFGLANAPSTFQRLMQRVLQGLIPEKCLDYVDDILVLGKTFAEHLQNFHDVFTQLRDAGLCLKPSKCALAQTEVT